MFDDIEDYIEEHGGVVTVSELATLTDENENAVRRWARENDVRRCGATFVFGADKALEFAEDVAEDEDEGLDDDDADDDVDEEGDNDRETDLDDDDGE